MITKANILKKLQKCTKDQLLDALELIEQKAQIELELLPTTFKIEMGEIEKLNSEHTEQSYYDSQTVNRLHEEDNIDTLNYRP